MLWRISFVLIACFVSKLHAASPQIREIAPVGGQRGTTVDIRIQGDRLADAQQILWYDPGFTVTDFKTDPGNFLTAKLAVAADCELGLHGFRVRTATGISNLITFSVGALPEISEAEPNNEFENPQKVALNSTINGVVENEDVDYFLIDAKKGQRINLEIEGVRLGYTFFDPYVSVLDAGRFELVRSDDSALARQDSVCSFVAPNDGAYVIQVRESAFRGGKECKYRLHVGTFPRPTAVLPYGGKPGETLSVRWLGDPAGERTEQITLPATAPSQFSIFARDEAGIAPLPNRFVLKDLAGILETEPNNDAKEATNFKVPCAVHGVIATEGDVDHFKFTATKGQVLDVRVLARQLGSTLDSVVNVSTESGGGVGGNDDNAGSPDSYQRVTIPEDGTYVIRMQDHLKSGGSDYAYRIEVAPPQRELTMALPETSRFVDATVPVPRGNRYAILVGAERREFGTDVKLEIKDLPAGVQVDGDLVPVGRPNIPVLLTAAVDAELDGRLVDLVGNSTDPNIPQEGRLLQRTSLVRGDNDRDVWHFDTERMAVAVTQESPYSIEIVQPKCPLVRGGSMNLKVVATRKEGFNAPIALRFLYAPPGVGVNNSISIAEGQNEVLVPITADGTAEINTWKIAVIGEAPVEGGPLSVSTQLADLQVAEPFLAFTFQAASVEQGQSTDVVIQVEKRHDWEGPAKIELLGLPHEVTSESKEITKETTELIFPVKTTANSPAGQHNTLICRAVIMINGEPVTQGLGGGKLRIDVPLPPKTTEPTLPETPVAKAPEPAPEKRLTRLEKLRQERAMP